MLESIISSMSIMSMILLILGFVLIGIELTMPGISFPGIAGIVCLVITVFLVADNIVEGVILTMIILAILGIMLGIMLWLFSKGRLVKPLILTEEQKKETGYISSSDLEHLLGKEGLAVTDLRPSGVGVFDDIKLDIISEGEYILKGTPVIVSKVKGSKLVVKNKSL